MSEAPVRRVVPLARSFRLQRVTVPQALGRFARATQFLELETPEVSATAAPAIEAPAAVEADNPEVTTKLELAQAYEEMGDIEGMRELLQEVLSEGSAAQQESARSKLAQHGF